MINQGREAGITGEEGKSAADKQLEALNRMIAALEQIVVLLGGEIPAEADKLRNLKIEIETEFSVDDSNVTASIDDLVKTGVVIPLVYDPVGGGGGFPFPVPSATQSGGFVVSTFFGKHGTPGFDFRSFGGETPAVLHGDEAIIPRGGGNELAAEIAAAMGDGGGGMTLQINEGAIRVEGGPDAARRFLDSLTDVVQGGGREVSRWTGAMRGASG